MQIDIIQLLAAIGTTALAIVTVWKTLRTNPKENRRIDADTVDKYEAIAARVAIRNEKLLERIHGVENKYDVMKSELERLLDLMIDWEIGINLLIDQLSEAGIDPDWRPAPSKLAKSS